MKKRIFKPAVFCCLLLLMVGASACSSDYDEPEQPTTRQNENPADEEDNGSGKESEGVVVAPISDVDEEFQKFMDDEFPDDVNFVHSHHFFQNSYHDSFLIINSQEELLNAYQTDANESGRSVPKFNFDNYTLVIGQVYNVSNRYVCIEKRQLCKMADGSYTMDLYIPVLTGDDWTTTANETDLYFWSVYPKLETTKIEMNVIKTDYQWDTTVENRTGIVHYDSGQNLWFIQESVAGTIDSVNRYYCVEPLKEEFKKDGVKVVFSGKVSKRQTSSASPIAGISDYNILLTEISGV